MSLGRSRALSFAAVSPGNSNHRPPLSPRRQNSPAAAPAATRGGPAQLRDQFIVGETVMTCDGNQLLKLGGEFLWGHGFFGIMKSDDSSGQWVPHKS